MAESMAVVADAFRADTPAVDVTAMIMASSRAASRSIDEIPDQALSGQLSSALIRYVHRLLLPADPFAGQYRASQIWLVDPTGKSKVDMECPGWDKVPALVETLISEWNRNYSSVAADARKLAIPSMARFFHSLLAIHPFIDGNGRLARELLSLQARELLGLEENLLIERGSGYYSALRSADAQEFDALEQLISNAIAGAQRA